jgi:hypothetical protein
MNWSNLWSSAKEGAYLFKEIKIDFIGLLGHEVSGKYRRDDNSVLLRESISLNCEGGGR